MLTLTALLFAVFLLLIVAYLWYIRRAYDFFEKLRIPGPSPVLFFGNFLEVVKSRRFASTLHKWTEQYGRIYGYFEGHTPILVVSDPDILQDVFIKSFSNFHSRDGSSLSKIRTARMSISLVPRPFVGNDNVS